jgi:hypothetical protein
MPRIVSTRGRSAVRAGRVPRGLLQCQHACLPEVLASRDIIPLTGRAWFMTMLQCGRLPGIQVVPGGVWRCERETFLTWVASMNQGGR